MFGLFFFIICHSEIWYDPCAIFRTYHDVFQLEISVNNALTVYKLESIGDVSRPSNYTSHGTRCLGQTRYIVPILENASHQVFFAKFHHKSYSQPFFFSNQCSTIEIYDEWIIQLPRKNLDSWITFRPMSLRQYHSFFHRLIVAKLWFHFVVKCFHFVSLFKFLLVTNVNYQKSKALGPKNYLQNKIKKLQRQLKQGNKQRARKG